MFTGIIEELGKIRTVKRKNKGAILEIASRKIYEDAKVGDSISVNGVCLTVIERNKNILTFDAMNETLLKTNLKNLKKDACVNLERSLRADRRMSGHFVYGHIDGIRALIGMNKTPSESFIDIGIEESDHKYVIEKGSIAVDGISLTIGRVFHNKIRIYLIAYTLKNTTISSLKVGDYVNIEFDVIGKYANKCYKDSKITEEFLKEKGF